ncbi:hypothetical protein EMIT0194P_10263 [Pseudomonas serbica]
MQSLLNNASVRFLGEKPRLPRYPKALHTPFPFGL